MIAARRYRLSGRVQGVGFRAFTERVARAEGLGGHVRNLDDGGVEVEAEGEGEALARFEARLRRGPVGARVDAIEIDALTPTGRRGRFVVSI